MVQARRSTLRRVLTRPWLLPPVWFLPFNLALFLLDRGLPLVQLVRPPWSYLGWLPILLGMGLCFVAARQFRRHRTTIRPFHGNAALITTGLFRFSRNPIYLGMVVIMLGIAVNAGSLSAFLIPPLFALALDAFFIRREESALARQFGDRYATYRRRVRRWL
jgi:protein-S-isoprenylcysteine O-methyltransferase Ste14